MKLGSNTVTRVGPAPGGTSPKTTVRARDADEARQVQYAEALVTAARAAAQYCSYADQMQAAGSYLKAADAFAKVGDARRQQLATESAAAASARADECEARSRSRGKPARPRQTAGQGGDDGDVRRCAPYRANYDNMLNAGILETSPDMQNIRDLAANARCPISVGEARENRFGAVR